MVDYISHDGIEYEFVGHGTKGADRDPVTILRKASDGSLEVFDDCVITASVVNKDGTTTPRFQPVIMSPPPRPLTGRNLRKRLRNDGLD